MAGVSYIESWKYWEKFGRSEYVKAFKQIIESAEKSFLDGDILDKILRLVYDLFWKCMRGRIRRESVIVTLSELIVLHWDLYSLVLDVLNIIDAENAVMVESLADERHIFCQLVKDIEKIVPDKLLKERLEIDTLQEVGTVKNKIFYTKFIKIKTKLYYKQRRFNLFREESEGYAKLITELNLDSDNSSVVPLNTVKSLIGCFNLDPNRVLDIILESFETRPERQKIFIPLLQSYMSNGSIICEVLGYKYRHFSGGLTPTSLYKITALLLKYGVIRLAEIYCWLFPSDKNICQDWEQDSAAAKEFVRKMNIISTNKEKDTETEPEKDLVNNKYSLNQKWGLCEAILKAGDWLTAEKLLKNLPNQCAAVNEPIARALAAHINMKIDALYRKKCFLPDTLKVSTSTEKKIEIEDFYQLQQQVFPMISALGPSLHHDCILLQKLIRIMRTILSEMNIDHLNTPKPGTVDEIIYFEILSLLDISILPSLSYLDCNCCVAEEIWTVVRFYPYQFRYSLYSRWKNETYLCHPMLIRRRGIAQKNIKSLMKRVSKENVKPVGRLIGKLSHSAPGFLFDYILLQIQIYDNLISPVVDSLKYLTSLSYDMLGYCLIESLSTADRDRFKHDGTSLSMWLQSLANFCGAIYKKYNIELSGLLQYVANQLKSHKSLDLLILKEVVQKMTGIEAAEEMTNEQLYAMSGGELLRGEAGYFSQVRNTKKSSQRLKDALASNDLSVTLCLLMAQQKHCVIYRETANNHLKLVGRLYDQCQDTLVQFGTFLGSTYSVDEYVERLPSIHSMLQEYHIHSDVAFFLARPMFSHQINQKYDQLRKSDPNIKKLTTNQKLQKYLEATAAIMDPIVESVKPLHFSKVWEDISPQFLVTFWSLSMYDLQVPVNSYQKEITKLKQLSLSALESKDTNLTKGKKEQERFMALMEKLQDEKKKHQEHVDKIFQRLSQEKDEWFLSRSAKSAKNETISQFLQLCLFPRCTFTALDAIYCAKFVHTIHNLKAANFSTLLCYDRIFCDITYSVTSCTENEATRYGRFLCAMMETVMKWHADQTVFNRECSNYPGFVTKFRVSNQFSEANDHVGYENYRHVCHKWHYKITKAILFCLDSKDFIQIRNALIILMRILPHFPVLTKLAQIIERKVEKVREEEKNHRPDLFVLASSYIGKLKTKSPQMIKENDFHQVSEKPCKDTIELKASVSNGENKQEKREKEKVDKRANKLVVAEKDVKNELREDLNDRNFNKELRKDEKPREKEKDDEFKKRDKRKDYRHESPVINETALLERNVADYYEYDKDTERERDLSSVSNSSAGSLQRRNQDVTETDLKRRKLESSGCKRNEESIIDVKKDRSSKTRERKEKFSDEEKDARKERKLGRKRERMEDNIPNDHKRRREGNQNGDEDCRDKYHPRDKSPHSRELKSVEKERSHEKFEREKQSYNFSKSARSRIGY